MFVRKLFVPPSAATRRARFEEALARHEAVELEEGPLFVTEIVGDEASGAWVYLESAEERDSGGDEPLTFAVPL